MKDQTCERWISCFERSETGDALEAEEYVFFEDHRRSCRRCANEWNGLQALALPKVVSVDSDDVRAIERALRAAARHSGRNRRNFVVPGLIALAASASLAVAYLVTRPSPFFVLAEKQGSVTVNGEERATGSPLAVGEKVVVRQGRACLSVSTGGQLCLESETEASPYRDSGAERTLHLFRGAVEVRMGHQPPGIRVGVHTDEGDVLAIGTVFRVVRREAVEVQVTEGRVLTRSAFREEVLHAGAPRMLKPTGLTLPALATGSSPAAADIVNSVDQQRPAASQDAESTDRVPRPDSRAGPHAADEVRSTPRAQQGGERPSTQAALKQNPKVTSPPIRQATGLASRTAQNDQKEFDGPRLLREARLLRTQGRDAEAARLLERLIAEDGQSEEANAALLTLTDLELTSLQQPERALRHARQYLAGSGGLRDEAAFRELRALEALQKDDEADRLRERFLLEFPRSSHLEAIRKSRNRKQ
jgi:FecR protein